MILKCLNIYIKIITYKYMYVYYIFYLLKIHVIIQNNI